MRAGGCDTEGRGGARNCDTLHSKTGVPPCRSRTRQGESKSASRSRSAGGAPRRGAAAPSTQGNGGAARRPRRMITQQACGPLNEAIAGCGPTRRTAPMMIYEAWRAQGEQTQSSQS